jgi:fructose-1,6-bisphosphatase
LSDWLRAGCGELRSFAAQARRLTVGAVRLRARLSGCPIGLIGLARIATYQNLAMFEEAYSASVKRCAMAGIEYYLNVGAKFY